jgi:hypothetical protein
MSFSARAMMVFSARKLCTTTSMVVAAGALLAGAVAFDPGEAEAIVAEESSGNAPVLDDEQPATTRTQETTAAFSPMLREPR